MSPSTRRPRRTSAVARLAALGLAALSLAACGGGDDSTGPSNEGQLLVRNQSTLTIETVYISPCADDSWGDDHLGAADTIAPGAQRSFTLAPGCYDVRAVANSGADAEWWDQEIAAGQTRQVTAGGGSAMVARGGE